MPTVILAIELDDKQPTPEVQSVSMRKLSDTEAKDLKRGKELKTVPVPSRMGGGKVWVISRNSEHYLAVDFFKEK